MREGKPSRTAEYMALFRALEDARPPAVRLFNDPFAQAFLGPGLRLALAFARLPGMLDPICRFVDERWPGVRTSAVARTRYIDDRVRAAVAAGLQQIVILGAGFDARAYRLPECATRTVFEVDHPATQARKRRLVQHALPGTNAHVRYVPTDFDRDTIETDLASAGFDPRRSTLFIWEGVTNYLTEDAVDQTLRRCARAVPRSGIVFTYVDQAVIDDPDSFYGTEKLRTSLEAAGERWTFGLDPEDTPDYLSTRGYDLEEDIGAADYRRRYYGPAADAMRGYEFYRIACARVSG
jgi:methyltransferase (TIGR00027 family)